MKNKIIFDYFLALLISLLLLIPFFILWIICSIDTNQNGIFTQIRIGKNARKFKIYKFRSLKGNYKSNITISSMKYSFFGKFLRNYGLDEIPQIINILNGTMSFVGPRPDVEGYADKLTGQDKIILNFKPGITGPAQIKYRNEIEILDNVDNPKEYNDQILWPDKIQINKNYIKNWSLTKDLYYIYKTFF